MRQQDTIGLDRGDTVVIRATGEAVTVASKFADGGKVLSVFDTQGRSHPLRTLMLPEDGDFALTGPAAELDYLTDVVADALTAAAGVDSVQRSGSHLVIRTSLGRTVQLNLRNG